MTCCAPPADWAADTGLREDYMTRRPNVERPSPGGHPPGTPAQAPLPWVAKNHAWLKRRTAALNLRNLIGTGLARRGGAWVLAT